jgi:ABC-type uncharacterized transport system permease subunit
LNKTTSKMLTGFKYIYLIVFFVLLSGFFHPLITHTSIDSVVLGTMILFVGLAGAVLLYKAAVSEKRRELFLGGGFGLITISLFYIFQIIGRF